MSAAEEPKAAKRADARRNERALLDAAAAVFVTHGVDAPVRRIAAEAGVGMGTIYRHFPKRADLVAAVYRHQVDACAEAGPELLATAPSPFAALRQWVELFVDFLVTKHGLAAALRNDPEGFTALHGLFVDRLVPVLDDILTAARKSGEVKAEIGAYQLLRAIGDISAGAEMTDPAYDARLTVRLLLDGCRV
ncbi:AcrR family transcriptional regulator [Amycolatopsis bartoniae]|uniref:TetR family transcriptional regulator n=1 Tax=Amycolatopsis bartoniae TaxID=941986 RepID=A0A8H9J2R3_9PSEU|nr:TetR/AcrR family transcriptional regulator [Amycolatopsis bartoniae]MBB2938800.1 AcrR family transcriptional regulator [Amycolatopsis bartoniae]TVS99211.1 TetR/AcrR family transcriptional regulator [Amycolatopsis bartoniae]GHF89038.1 TetR family transcriptional regulator [Amycolatopsis bartoniae]